MLDGYGRHSIRGGQRAVVDVGYRLEEGAHVIHVVNDDADRRLYLACEPFERVARKPIREIGYLGVVRSDVERLQRFEVEVGQV